MGDPVNFKSVALTTLIYPLDFEILRALLAPCPPLAEQLLLIEKV
jgi:hypothetical protein